MGADIKTIYIENSITRPVIHFVNNVNSWLFAEDPRSIISNVKRNLEIGFYGNVDKKDFYEIKIEKGIDAVAIITAENKFICVYTDDLTTTCSNMSTKTKNKWKRRIISLIQKGPTL